jgi:hypothetical protein
MRFLVALLAINALAEESPDLMKSLRNVTPAGWQVVQEAGTASVHVKRIQLISPKDITLHAVPSAPFGGPRSLHYAETTGISVQFEINPVGVCSDVEYSTRKAHNDKIWAQLEPLRKKIERIPHSPQAKPSFLSRAPRNDEEKSWITEWKELWSQLQVMPTHHFGERAFMVLLLKSYGGANITAPQLLKEILEIQISIESVLVPYGSVPKES